MSDVKLGKISSVRFGFGGYQDCMLGLWLQFDMRGSSVNAGIEGHWILKRDNGAKWTEKDRIEYNGLMCANIVDVLKKAKVTSVDQLMGIPVKLHFKGMMLSKWEVLEEVL